MHKDSSFTPAWWATNPHLQTLFPTWHRRRAPVDYQPQRLELNDGDFIDLAWAELPPRDTRQSIVVLFHGLEGSVQSPYAKGMLHTLRQQGHYPVLMHFRGCSGEPNRLARGYHSGETGDAAYLLAHLQRHYPKAALAAVGYSLGGNMLLKLQSELGEDSPLKAAVSVCAPLDLALCADRIGQGLSRVYQHHLVSRMKQNLRRKLATGAYPAHLQLTDERIDALQTFWQFDDTFTAPVHGFIDVHDYYRRASAKGYLGQIRRPTLVIQAIDDPFMSPDVIPSANELSPSVELEVSHRGGHVGFISGRNPFKPVYYLEQRIPAYLESYLP